MSHFFFWKKKSHNQRYSFENLNLMANTDASEDASFVAECQ